MARTAGGHRNGIQRARRWAPSTRGRLRAGLLLLSLTWSPGLAAQVRVPEELSLERALAITVENNPGYLAQRNDDALADWDVRAAYGQLLPSASASGGVSWQGGGQQLLGGLTQEQLGVGAQPSYYFSRYSLGVGYQLSGSTLFAPSQARASREVTEALLAQARADLEKVVTDAYLDVLRQTEQAALSEQQLERARFDLRLADARQSVGEVTALDVMQAELQVGRAEVALLQARNAIVTTRMLLLQQMGVAADLDAPLVLTTEFGLIEPTWEREELLRLAFDSNPFLRSRREAVDVAEVGERIAKWAYYPSLSAQLGWSGFTRQASDTQFLVGQARSSVENAAATCAFQNEVFSRLADPLPPTDCSRFVFTDETRRAIEDANNVFPFDFTSSPPSASLTISVPIFQGLTRQRGLEAARLQNRDARLQVREQELAVGANVSVGLVGVRNAYESAILEQRNQTYADEQLRLARERYQLGATTFIELVEAQTVKRQADQQLLAAIYAYHDAITFLESVTGTPLRPR